LISYIIRRLLYAILVLFGVATVVFFIGRLSGDPVKLMLPANATPEQVETLRRTLGLDEPLLVQYLDFLARLAHLDLGRSLYFDQPSIQLILERLPATIQLAAAAFVFAMAVAIPAGIIAAVWRGSIVEGVVQLVVLVGQSTPAFWVGILLILVFAVQLEIFPTGGVGGPQYLVLPAVTLGFYLMAMVARLLRSSMLEVLNEDYIKTARAKGVSSFAVITRHAFRNALLPTITVIGLEIGSLFGGAVLTETVFAWPGVGSLIVEALNNRDFPLVQAVVIILAGIFVVVNLLVDISYAVLDPRIRYD
jgi:peptide/nickel transport system permease protein